MTEPTAAPICRIIVYGVPSPGGSKTAMPIYAGRGPDRRFTGRINYVDDGDLAKETRNRTMTWRQAVVAAARDAIACRCPDPLCGALAPGYPLDEALVLSLVFTVAKPASNPKTRRTWPAVKPDLLKYARPTEDALKDAGLYRDDSRVVDYNRLAKVYPREDPDALDTPGARITIWRKADLVDWQRDAVAVPTTGTLFE